MSRAKVVISILTVLILVALSGVSAWAAPGRQEPVPDPTETPTTISGEVQNIVIEVDEETATTTVLVTLLIDEATGQTQTVRLSLETATALGLVGQDENGNPIANQDMIGTTVEINTSDVIEDGEETLHPVASALAEFFADTLGLDYDTIMGYHEDGIGFGVIAKACWMSIALEGDATLVGSILEAKKSGDFSSITLPNGETPKNWGQFKKAVMGSDKAKENLGAVMSGKANGEQEQETTVTSSQGKGNKKGNDGVPPVEPPGQDKEGKDKGGKGKGKQ